MGSSRRLTRRPARESPVLFTPLSRPPAGSAAAEPAPVGDPREDAAAQRVADEELDLAGLPCHRDPHIEDRAAFVLLHRVSVAAGGDDRQVEGSFPGCTSTPIGSTPSMVASPKVSRLVCWTAVTSASPSPTATISMCNSAGSPEGDGENPVNAMSAAAASASARHSRSWRGPANPSGSAIGRVTPREVPSAMSSRRTDGSALDAISHATAGSCTRMSMDPPAGTVLPRSTSRTASATNRGSTTATSPIRTAAPERFSTRTCACRSATSARSWIRAARSSGSPLPPDPSVGPPAHPVSTASANAATSARRLTRIRAAPRMRSRYARRSLLGRTSPFQRILLAYPSSRGGKSSRSSGKRAAGRARVRGG